MHGALSQSGQSEQPLFLSCDGLSALSSSCRSRKGGGAAASVELGLGAELAGLPEKPGEFPRVYPTWVPWDVVVALLLMGLFAAILAIAPFASLRALGVKFMSDLIMPVYYAYFLPEAIGLFVFAVVIALQIPRLVVREKDRIVIHYLFHSQEVLLRDVLELVVLDGVRKLDCL